MTFSEIKIGQFFTLDGVEYEASHFFPASGMNRERHFAPRLLDCYVLDDLSERIPNGEYSNGEPAFKKHIVSDVRFNAAHATPEELEALSLL